MVAIGVGTLGFWMRSCRGVYGEHKYGLVMPAGAERINGGNGHKHVALLDESLWRCVPGEGLILILGRNSQRALVSHWNLSLITSYLAWPYAS
ncbi:hypothetical protein RJT34_12016 [Clitoria ternatea]|uniref:Uncharacterized protein n=1 Tax=Clitoria ternatea TaxID=43366 RepID=A0AAN9JL01_CLITE